MIRDPRVEGLNLPFQHVHQLHDPRQYVRVRRGLALPLTDLQSNQLPATGHQRMEVLLRFIRHRFGEAVPIRAFVDHFRQLRQHQSIDAIGLCQPAHGFGEVPCLPGIDHRYAETCCLQRAGAGELIATSGLHDDERYRLSPQRCNEGLVALFIVPKCRCSAFPPDGYIERVLRYVDTDDCSIGHDLYVPSLQMRMWFLQLFGLAETSRRHALRTDARALKHRGITSCMLRPITDAGWHRA